MPSEDLSRRGLLKLGTAAAAALAGCLSERSGPPAASPGSDTPRPAACGTPVGDAWDGVDESPTPPPCPARPDPLRACAARAYALDLEKHLRYARAIDRYDGIDHLEYGVSDATVHARSPGFLVHADVFFSGNTTSGTPPGTGTRTPSHFDDTYTVSYLVTPDGQWRATDRTGAARASRAPRRDGSPVSCSGDSTPDATPGTGSDTGTGTGTEDAGGSARVASLSVADFVLYPRSGTHPHVHRRPRTQYAVVRLHTPLPRETVRNRLRLELDGEAASLARRQPVPWRRDTVSVAFAVPKGEPVDVGRVLFDGSVLRSLSEATLERLNRPPAFEVAEPSVSPDSVAAGERTTATVRFGLTNAGDGRGTFGASLAGNFLSGANTVTATLDAGASRDIAADVGIVGEGDGATVRLDWGSDRWSTTVPVVGRATGSETSTPGA